MALDAFKLTDDDESASHRWQELPPILRFLPIFPLKQNARPLLVEMDSAQPMLTESQLEIGRCFFFGANETWRWGEKDADRFWLQLIRYAAEEPYSVTSNGVSLDANVAVASPQQSVLVRARLLDDNGVPLSERACQLKVVQDGKRFKHCRWRDDFWQWAVSGDSFEFTGGRLSIGPKCE